MIQWLAYYTLKRVTEQWKIFLVNGYRWKWIKFPMNTAIKHIITKAHQTKFRRIASSKALQLGNTSMFASIADDAFLLWEDEQLLKLNLRLWHKCTMSLIFYCSSYKNESVTMVDMWAVQTADLCRFCVMQWSRDQHTAFNGLTHCSMLASNHNLHIWCHIFLLKKQNCWIKKRTCRVDKSTVVCIAATHPTCFHKSFLFQRGLT